MEGTDRFLLPPTRGKRMHYPNLRLGLLLLSALALLTTPPTDALSAEKKMRYAIIIHGGAGSDPQSWSAEFRDARKAALRKALASGVGVLKAGGSSLDAVEAAVRTMEDDPVFNAGRGAVLNDAGGFQLDASIMDGRTKACGAVAGVSIVKNPIRLSRLVMTKTRHVLLATDGADAFARQMKVDLVEQSYFRTERQMKAWKQRQQRERQQGDAGADSKGTVGCAALDSAGNLAAGTSTGGLMFKKFGRIGDSPIVGAGTYADNASCAVSCTGVGEHFIRHAIAYDVSARMRYQGKTLKEAVDVIIKKTLKPGYGGIIAVSRTGEIVDGFNTGGMSRAAADQDGTRYVKLGSE